MAPTCVFPCLAERYLGPLLRLLGIASTCCDPANINTFNGFLNLRLRHGVCFRRPLQEQRSRADQVESLAIAVGTLFILHLQSFCTRLVLQGTWHNLHEATTGQGCNIPTTRIPYELMSIERITAKLLLTVQSSRCSSATLLSRPAWA